jgi:hypothetical protein
VIIIIELNKIIMKGLILTIGLLMSIGGYAQTPSFPTTTDKWVAPIQSNQINREVEVLRRGQRPEILPNQRHLDEVNRNQNIIILMVNENQIRNINRWRLWHRLKERRRFRIVRRWQKRHERNNIEPEYSKRRHR